jgi:hypothetical protein
MKKIYILELTRPNPYNQVIIVLAESEQEARTLCFENINDSIPFHGTEKEIANNYLSFENCKCKEINVNCKSQIIYESQVIITQHMEVT